MALMDDLGTDSARSVEPGSRARTGKSWLHDWHPEDPIFWAATGKAIATRNLIFSILAEHIGFSVWFIWSIVTGYMVADAGGKVNALGFS